MDAICAAMASKVAKISTALFGSLCTKADAASITIPIVKTSAVIIRLACWISRCADSTRLPDIQGMALCAVLPSVMPKPTTKVLRSGKSEAIEVICDSVSFALAASSTMLPPPKTARFAGTLALLQPPRWRF